LFPRNEKTFGTFAQINEELNSMVYFAKNSNF